MAGIAVKPENIPDLIKSDPTWGPKIKAARDSGASYDDIQQKLVEGGTLNKAGSLANVQRTGFAGSPREIAATAVRVGLPIGLAMFQPRALAMGTMAAETLAQKIEGKRLGLGDTKAQAEVVMAGVTSRLAPGLEGTTPAGMLKGAGFGAVTTSVQSLLETGHLPAAGQMSLGIALGAGLTGAGRQFLKPALYNISHKAMAEEVSSILLRPSESIIPATAAEKEAIQDIRGIKFIGKGGSSGELPGEYSYTGHEPENYYKARARRPMLEGYVTPIEEGGKRTQWRPMDFFGEQPEEVTGPTRNVQGVKFKGEGGPTEPLGLGRGPLKPIPEDTIKDRWHNITGPPKVWFDRIQRKTGLPVYEEIYHPTQVQLKKKSVMDHEIGSEFAGAVDVVRHRNREKYQAFIEMGRTDESADKLQLKIGDRMRTQKMQDGWHRMFQSFGMTKDEADSYLTEVVPKLRATAHELDPNHVGNISPKDMIDHAYPVGKPRSLEFFQGMYHDEIEGFHDTDSLGIAMRHLNYGTNKLFLNDTIEQIKKKYSDPKIPQRIGESITKYLGQVQGASDPTGADLAAVIHAVGEKLNWDIKPKNVKAVVNTMIASTYGGTMGFKPGPILRNSMQVILTGFSELGPRYTPEALVRASTKEGKDLATRLGFLEGEQGITGEVHGLLIQAKGTPTEKWASRIGNVTSAMLASYKSRDDYNRVFMGLGAYSRAQRAIRIAKGDVDKFMDYSRFNSSALLDSERAIVRKTYESGNHNEAARLGSLATIDNTQWQYGPGNKPPILTGTAGRGFGGFATWSAYYANYLKRTANPLNVVMGKKGDAIRWAQWLAANAALWGAAGALNQSLGIEHPFKRAFSGIGLGPMWYLPGGAPAAKIVTETIKTGMQASQADIDKSQLKRMGKAYSTMIPGAGMALDFLHLAKPDKGEGEAIGRVSGVAPRPYKE